MFLQRSYIRVQGPNCNRAQCHSKTISFFVLIILFIGSGLFAPQSIAAHSKEHTLEVELISGPPAKEPEILKFNWKFKGVVRVKFALVVKNGDHKKVIPWKNKKGELSYSLTINNPSISYQESIRPKFSKGKNGDNSIYYHWEITPTRFSNKSNEIELKVFAKSKASSKNSLFFSRSLIISYDNIKLSSSPSQPSTPRKEIVPAPLHTPQDNLLYGPPIPSNEVIATYNAIEINKSSIPPIQTQVSSTSFENILKNLSEKRIDWTISFVSSAIISVIVCCLFTVSGNNLLRIIGALISLQYCGKLPWSLRLFFKAYFNNLKSGTANPFLKNIAKTEAFLDINLAKGTNSITCYDFFKVYKTKQSREIDTKHSEIRYAIITGDPGQGKTMLLKWCVQIEKPYLTHIPIYIKLTDISEFRRLNTNLKPKEVIYEYLKEEFFGRQLEDTLNINNNKWSRYSSKFCPTEIMIKHWIHKKRLILLLDALDECPETKRGDIFDSISEFYKNYGCKIFVTSRNNASPELIGRIEEYKIDEYSEDAMYEYIASFKVQNPSEGKDFNDFYVKYFNLLLMNGAGFAKIGRNPLMLSMLMFLYYDDKKNGQTYDMGNLSSLEYLFYEEAITNFFKHRSLNKAINLTIGEQQINQFFIKLCGKIVPGEVISFNNEMVNKTIIEVFGNPDDKDILKKYNTFVVDDIGILKNNKERNFTFYHNSFYDYFHAKWLATDIIANYNTIATLIRNDNHWDVIKFVIGSMSSESFTTLIKSLEEKNDLDNLKKAKLYSYLPIHHESVSKLISTIENLNISGGTNTEDIKKWANVLGLMGAISPIKELRLLAVDVLKSCFENQSASDVRALILNHVFFMPFEEAFSVVYEWIKTAKLQEVEHWRNAKYRGLYLLDKSLQKFFKDELLPGYATINKSPLGETKEKIRVLNTLFRAVVSHDNKLRENYFKVKLETLKRVNGSNEDQVEEALCVARLLWASGYTEHCEEDKTSWLNAQDQNKKADENNVYEIIYSKINLTYDDVTDPYQKLLGIPPSLAIKLIKCKLQDNEQIKSQIRNWVQEMIPLSAQYRSNRNHNLSNLLTATYNDSLSSNADNERNLITNIETMFNGGSQSE